MAAFARALGLAAFLGAAEAQGNCHAITPAVSDAWCMSNCNHDPPFCPADMCACSDTPTPPPSPPTPVPGTPTPPPTPAPPTPPPTPAPTPAPTPPPAPTPAAACLQAGYNATEHVGVLPSFLVSGYICPTCACARDPQALLDALPAAYNVVNVAFIGWNADGSIYPIFDEPDKDFTLSKATVAALQAQGRKVLISIGGGLSPILTGADNNAAFIDAMVAGIQGVVEAYGFDGVDFDVEHFSGDYYECGQVIVKVVSALKFWRSSLLISAAPELPNLYPEGAGVAAGQNEYAPIFAEAMACFDWVQPQLYNAWSQVQTTEYAQKYAQLLDAGYTASGWGHTFDVRVPAGNLLLGYPAAPGGAGSGYIAPEQVVQMVKDLKAKGTAIRGLMTWSIGWDETDGWKWSKAVAELAAAAASSS